MKFEGRITKDGRWWLVEVPALEAMTQGRTRTEACEMICDWIRTMLDDPNYEVVVQDRSRRSETVWITAEDPAKLIALMLRRQREAGQLSLAQVAANLGSKSRNAYARYEQGKAVPAADQLGRLVRAARPSADVVVTVR